MRYTHLLFVPLFFLTATLVPTQIQAQSDCMSEMDFSITQSKSEPSEVYFNVILPVTNKKLGVKSAEIRATNDPNVPYILSVYLKNKLLENNHGVVFTQTSAEGKVTLDPKKSIEVIIYFPDGDSEIKRKKKGLIAHEQFD